MFDRIIYEWTMIWVTIEPVSSLSLFVALTARMTEAERRQVAQKAVLVSAAILLFAIVAGQLLLAAMKIKLISFQVAGGVILMLFGLQMIFGKGNGNDFQQELGHDIAVFPLALPSLVGAETIMAVMVLTDNHIHTFAQQVVTTFVMFAVLAVIYLLLTLAGAILRLIGHNGVIILEKVTGMILTGLSVELIMTALGIDRWAGP